MRQARARFALAARAAGAPAAQARRRRPGQQDGADRLGNHDARRDVSAPDRGIERPTANEVRKATSKMAIGRTEDRQNPYGELRASTPPLCLEPIRGTHLGQRSYPTARKGRTHDRKRSDCLIMPNCLAKRGPSTHVSVVNLKPAQLISSFEVTDH